MDFKDSLGAIKMQMILGDEAKDKSPKELARLVQEQKKEAQKAAKEEAAFNLENPDLWQSKLANAWREDFDRAGGLS